MRDLLERLEESEPDEPFWSSRSNVGPVAKQIKAALVKEGYSDVVLKLDNRFPTDLIIEFSVDTVGDRKSKLVFSLSNYGELENLTNDLDDRTFKRYFDTVNKVISAIKGWVKKSDRFNAKPKMSPKPYRDPNVRGAPWESVEEWLDEVIQNLEERRTIKEMAKVIAKQLGAVVQPSFTGMAVVLKNTRMADALALMKRKLGKIETRKSMGDMIVQFNRGSLEGVQGRLQPMGSDVYLALYA